MSEFYSVTGTFIAGAISSQIYEKYNSYFPTETIPVMYRTPPKKDANYPYVIIDTVEIVQSQTHNKYYTYESTFQINVILDPKGDIIKDYLNDKGMAFLEFLRMLPVPKEFEIVDGDVVKKSEQLVRCWKPSYTVEDNILKCLVKYNVNVRIPEDVYVLMQQLELKINVKN